MPSAPSNASGPGRDEASAGVTPSLDLDGLPAGVVTAIPTHAVRELGLVTLRTF